MAAAVTSPTTELPTRQNTMLSATTTGLSEDAFPDTNPNGAWKHACGYLEEYIGAVEKLHKEQAKEYEKLLKTISKPLREGQHFDQTVGGISGFFENMRSNTQALINTNLETEKNIKGSVLPVLDRLHKEIKNKAKELAHGAQRGAKEVEKARQLTQKHIEQLGQQTAAFEASGGHLNSHEDPYVLCRGVIHRLHKQVLEENNHHNDLLSVQANFKTFEAHVVQVLQQAMEAFNQFVGGQALRVQALYADMLASVQRVGPEFEWTSFSNRFGDILAHDNEPARTVEAITFPNQNHSSTNPVIEGSLERKSRNKLSFGWQTGYYVVTPSRFLHEFKDSDNVRKDPVPELSIYLPDAVISVPSGDKFTVKGKDRSKSMGSKLVGSSELSFKAHSADDAERWFYIIRDVAGSAKPESTPLSPLSPTSPSGTFASASTALAKTPSPSPPPSTATTVIATTPAGTTITTATTPAAAAAVAAAAGASETKTKSA